MFFETTEAAIKEAVRQKMNEEALTEIKAIRKKSAIGYQITLKINLQVKFWFLEKIWKKILHINFLLSKKA